MTVSVAVNLVPYSNSERCRQKSQFVAFTSIKAELEMYPFCFEGEVKYISNAYSLDPLLLKRNSQKEIGGGRQLPFIKEMIKEIIDPHWCCVDLGKNEWIGVINSDILITLKFLPKIKAIEPEIHAVAVHRTDVNQFFKDPPVKSGILHNGVDAFFMRYHVWKKWFDDFPDWVLGEPGWGQGAVKWCQLKGIPFVSLKGHETLHERHRAYWKTHMTPTKQHNQKLYRQVCTELGKKG